MIDDGSTDATAEVASLGGRPGRRRRRRAPRAGRRARARATRCGSRSYACRRRHPLLARRRHPQLRRRTSSPGCSAPLLTDRDVGVREGLLPAAAARRSRPAAAASPSWWPARCISTLFPQLARFVQPLAGEYAGPARRARDACRSSRAGASSSGCSRPRRAVRPRRDRAGRPRRARAPQPPARRARPAGDWRSSSTALRRAGCRPRRRARGTSSSRYRRRARARDRVPVEIRERPPMLTIPAYRAQVRLASSTRVAQPRPAEGAAAGLDRGFLDEQSRPGRTPRPPATPGR